MSGLREKKVYSIDKKKEILAYAKKFGFNEAVREFNISPNTLALWKKNRELNTDLPEPNFEKPKKTIPEDYPSIISQYPRYDRMDKSSINVNNFIRWIQLVNPDLYPAQAATIRRVQKWKRNAFIVDVAELINIFVGVDDAELREMFESSPGKQKTL